MVAAAQRDDDVGGAEEALLPMDAIRREFADSIRRYCALVPGSLAGNPSTFLGRLSDSSSFEHEKNFFLFCLISFLRRALQDLIEPESAAVLPPRSRMGGPLYLVTATEHKIKNDLLILLASQEWSLSFLRQAGDRGNILAKLICQALSYFKLFGGRYASADRTVYSPTREERSYEKSEGGREGNRSVTSTREDVIVELRLRLRRGRLWEDDPWWPQPSEESDETDEQAEPESAAE